MEKSSSKFLFTLLLISFFSLSSTQAKKTLKNQIDALNNLYKGKSNNDNYSTVGSSLFQVDDEDDVNAYKPMIIAQTGTRAGDRIGKWPGQPSVAFAQYGGYVTVDEKAGRAFYYYFAEAEKDKFKKPLLLWLNGGPGCSSLAYGAMTELGPFRVHSDGKTLYKNPYAWNNAANLLFLESPAGVGFSYSNTSSDVTSGGDRETAKDNTVFLLNWLERFPEYKDRDFYISGESYAGHYVPELAHNIIRQNQKANKTLINLKGIIIGNAVINEATDEEGMYDYFSTHALISDEVSSRIKKTCNFSAQSLECVDILNTADAAVGNIDIYNIYYPLCHNTNLTAKPKQASVSKFDPCADYYVYAYLNTPRVQKAIHANVTKMDYNWQPCSDVLKTWNDAPSTMILLLREFMEFYGIRVWVFSGDTDGRVPVTSTKYSLRKMNLTVNTPYYPWFQDQEVGGFAEEYKEGLMFTTVRGAGHQVPSYQPERALTLIQHFLDGTPLPSSPKQEYPL